MSTFSGVATNNAASSAGLASMESQPNANELGNAYDYLESFRLWPE